MAIGERIVFDEPDNLCFGCSPHNPRGLGVAFDHVEPSAVEGTYTAAPDLCGPEGIIHGGVQAVLLDEAVGFAIHAHQASQRGDGVALRDRVVTMEFSLRYRRPAPAGSPVVIRGEVVGEDGDDFVAEATIADPDGTVLTQCKARWRRIA